MTDVLQRYTQQIKHIELPPIGHGLTLPEAQRLLQLRLQLIDRACSVHELQGHALRAEAEIQRIQRDYASNDDSVVRLDLEGRKRIAQARILRAQEMMLQYDLEMDVFRAMIAAVGEDT